MESSEKEAARKKIKNSLSIFRYYTREEALEALLCNDVGKLAEMREAYAKLTIKLKQFESILQGDNEEEILRAIRTFQKPRL